MAQLILCLLTFGIQNVLAQQILALTKRQRKKKKLVSLAPPMIEEINARLNVYRWKRGRLRFSPHQWITRMTHSWLVQEILAGWWLITSHQRPVQMSNYPVISPALRSMTSLRLKRHFIPLNGCDGNKRNQFEKAGTINTGADLLQNYQSGPNLGGILISLSEHLWLGNY